MTRKPTTQHAASEPDLMAPLATEEPEGEAEAEATPPPADAAGDPWLATVTAIVSDTWARQAFAFERDRTERFKGLLEKRPDFGERCRSVAHLISTVTPRLADPSEATAVEYTDHLQTPLFHAVPFSEAGTHARYSLIACSSPAPQPPCRRLSDNQGENHHDDRHQVRHPLPPAVIMGPYEDGGRLAWVLSQHVSYFAGSRCNALWPGC